MNLRTLIATRDNKLSAIVKRRTELHYSEKTREGVGDKERPTFVRAASGIARFGGGFVVVQDDNNYLGFVSDDGAVSSIALPAGEGGRRRFEKEQGNKQHKLDFESCVSFLHEGKELLLAFGSGSTSARERWLVFDGREGRFFDASALYKLLRDAMGSGGGSLNLEGACLSSESLTLFHRGNGFQPGDLSGFPPSTFVFKAAEVLEWLFGKGAPPRCGR